MSDSYTQPFAIANSDATTVIAGCFGDVIGGHETAKANARLIAASPVLLSQLCCIEEVAAKNAEHLSADWCVVRDLARAAIAKVDQVQ